MNPTAQAFGDYRHGGNRLDNPYDKGSKEYQEYDDKMLDLLQQEILITIEAGKVGK